MGNWYIMGVINWYMVSNLYDIYIIWYINHVYIYTHIIYIYGGLHKWGYPTAGWFIREFPSI